jgi:hypothetical protein
MTFRVLRKDLQKFLKLMLFFQMIQNEQIMITHLIQLHHNKILLQITSVVINGKIQNLILTLITLKIPIGINFKEGIIFKFHYLSLSKNLMHLNHSAILIFNLDHLLFRWLNKYLTMYSKKIGTL